MSAIEIEVEVTEVRRSKVHHNNKTIVSQMVETVDGVVPRPDSLLERAQSAPRIAVEVSLEGPNNLFVSIQLPPATRIPDCGDKFTLTLTPKE